MSVKVSSLVWNGSLARGLAFTIMLYLADKSNDEGEAWPSVSLIAQKCRTDTRRVQRMLPELERLGELHRHVGGGARGATKYTLDLDLLGEPPGTRATPGTGTAPAPVPPPPTVPAPPHPSVEPSDSRNEKPSRAKPEKLSVAWTPESGWSGISPDDRQRWAVAYPSCDLDRQLGAAGEWLRANPQRAVKRNWARFITNWLEKSQERGGDTRSLYANGTGKLGAAAARRAAQAAREYD